MKQATEIPAGLVVLHGNRLELLRDAVLHCFAQWPLQPLEQETILVQSNGAGEWFKSSQAQVAGICAASRVELPARFVWRLFRQIIGHDALSQRSALDKETLTWRLMRLLPALVSIEGYESVAGFLGNGDPERRLQLARRLADLYDQYQIYRADWLELWRQGVDATADGFGRQQLLPAEQRWQAMLWRALLGELNAAQQMAVRPQVHREAIARLESGTGFDGPLPRRVTLFGAATIPGATLEVLVALARHAQVLIAVPNPCRFHWADIIDGREFLRTARRRHALRADRDLAEVSLEAMHAHAHPLLAAWGRQGRDFMRQLDAYDDAQSVRQRIGLPRTDLFDEAPGGTLLEQVQAAIRDLLPLGEHPRTQVAKSDRSIVFHVAHSAQREVEILHDQLLTMLAEQSPRPLQPRDIVVMVPDIEAFAPSIRAVFGQYSGSDPRFIPFDIADLRSRGSSPLALALEWLLNIGTQRMGSSEIHDLLDVPAIAARFGLADADKPKLAQWIQGAGIRWGLNVEQRARLGLGACGEQNAWSAGLRSMLLGYASGGAGNFEGIEPYDEIGGLDAALVGVLAGVLDRLERWWSQAAVAAAPAAWAERGRVLLQDWMEPTDERERLTVAAMEDALTSWLDACESAGFEAEVPLSVFREAWLAGLDEPSAAGRFLAGGVTFCSLMPLRSVPFEVVCLLGMNDGDFPRAGSRNDFDLMALPGQYRPGDRSRRDDDRYLVLEALLSARRTLSISWVGRSSRDNTQLPPSVLVAQLRDYLAAGWVGETQAGVELSGDLLLKQRTTEYPLQPFSRRYFEGGTLRTYAREWRSAHVLAPSPLQAPMPPFDAEAIVLDFDRLARFVRNPVKAFFRARLDVVFDDADEVHDDEEPFALDALRRHVLLQELVAQPVPGPTCGAETLVARRLARIRASGRLPMAGLGEGIAEDLRAAALPMLHKWHELASRNQHELGKVALRYEQGGVVFDDWLTGLRGHPECPVRLSLTASRVIDSQGKPPRAITTALVEPWLRMLVASSNGIALTEYLIGASGVAVLRAIAQDQAREHLAHVLEAWRAGMQEPLPWGMRTAVAEVEQGDPARTYEGGRNAHSAEVDDPYLARLFPNFDALQQDGRFARYAQTLFAPISDWAAGRVGVELYGAPAEAAIDE